MTSRNFPLRQRDLPTATAFRAVSERPPVLAKFDLPFIVCFSTVPLVRHPASFFPPTPAAWPMVRSQAR
jgi:hypothetical protein